MGNKRTAMPSDSPTLYIEASLRAAERREKSAIGRGTGLPFSFSASVFLLSEDKKHEKNGYSSLHVAQQSSVRGARAFAELARSDATLYPEERPMVAERTGCLWSKSPRMECGCQKQRHLRHYTCWSALGLIRSLVTVFHAWEHESDTSCYTHRFMPWPPDVFNVPVSFNETQIHILPIKNTSNSSMSVNAMTQSKTMHILPANSKPEN